MSRTSREPARYPLAASLIAGMGPYRHPAARSSAAPVGVTVSIAVAVSRAMAAGAVPAAGCSSRNLEPSSSKATVAGAGQGTARHPLDHAGSQCERTTRSHSPPAHAAPRPPRRYPRPCPPRPARAGARRRGASVYPALDLGQRGDRRRGQLPGGLGHRGPRQREQIRCGPCGHLVVDLDPAWQATRPACCTGSAVSSQPVSPVLATAARTASSGAPRSSSAPRSMSPEMPENGFSHKITVSRPVTRGSPAHPRAQRDRLRSLRQHADSCPGPGGFQFGGHRGGNVGHREQVRAAQVGARQAGRMHADPGPASTRARTCTCHWSGTVRARPRSRPAAARRSAPRPAPVRKEP